MQKGLINFVLALVFFVTGCDSTSKTQQDPLPADTWFELEIGGKTILAQIAISLTEKQRGLMYREQLGDDSGMLFPYDTPQKVTFWMKNTPLPLDIGMFDANGVLKEIHRLIPYDTTKVYSYSNEIQYTLEMHQGWFASNNFFPGTQLDLQSVAKAIQQRGKDPKALGIPDN